MRWVLYFQYTEEAINYLRKRDKKLGEAIDRIGRVDRAVTGDLFSSVVQHIIGQQISTTAMATICGRLSDMIGEITPQAITELSDERLQSIGLSFRKVEYIKSFARKVSSGEFSIAELSDLSDQEVIDRLSSLKGLGQWTAEMLMLFCMQRPDIVSYGDLAILRGMRMIYRHRVIDKKKFIRYAKRYSPYGSVASLYLWAVAGGAIPELTDPAPKKTKT